MQFQEKENIQPSMCSTPIINKRSKLQRSFARAPLTPLDINVKLKRSNPAEVEVLKTYIENLHNSYDAQLKEQQSIHEASLTEHTQKRSDIDLDGLSDKTQIAVLQKQLMKSNLDRDRHANSARNYKTELDTVTAGRAKLDQDNAELRRLISSLQESQQCSGEQCMSRDNLLSARQNYQILENSHKELELQVCHLATDIERKNVKFSELFEDKKRLEELAEDSDKRCSMYQNKIIKLETALKALKTNSSSRTTEYEDLRKEFEELKHNKSKLRTDNDFLLDERDTREITLDEIYKQLTETRKELAALRESDERLQENYQALSEKSEVIAKQFGECKEMLADTSEMCDFLHKKLLPVVPNLCNKHNVPYTEYQIQPQCPALIGSVLYIMHAVDVLEDLAGSVSINKDTRRQLHSLKDDNAVLERTITELKKSLSEQNEKAKKREAHSKMLTNMVVQYSAEIESNEFCLQELSSQVQQEKMRCEKLQNENEKHSIQVGRRTEDLTRSREQLQLYDEVLHTVKTRMLALGSSLPSTLKVVLQELV